MSEGKLIVLSGPSGVGKTTVVDRLLSFPGLERVITATTRKRRAGETNGVDYHYLSAEDFESGIHSGRFLEHAEVHGNHYGSPRETVEAGIRDGKWLLLAIDVQGVEQIQTSAADLPMVTIFLLPPSHEELVRRLGGRGSETATEIETRLRTAETELTRQDAYDFRVVNDQVDRTAEEILEIAGYSGRKS